MPQKMYLGDSVYVELCPLGLKLTTENGPLAPSNTIYLDGPVWDALKMYVDALEAQAREQQNAEERGE